MPTAKYYARIAITLPPRDLAAADKLARALDRSRSWIVAEAIRRFAAAPGTLPARDGSATEDDGSSAARLATPGLGASRLAQLTHDLTLTPEARVLAAEATLLQAGAPQRARRHHVLAFDRYEDFLDWKKFRDVRG